jgi:hypothetical protein
MNEGEAMNARRVLMAVVSAVLLGQLAAWADNPTPTMPNPLAEKRAEEELSKQYAKNVHLITWRCQGSIAAQFLGEDFLGGSIAESLAGAFVE